MARRFVGSVITMNMDVLMKIDEQTYSRMPEELRVLFDKLPNQSYDEVVSMFPTTKSGAMKHEVPAYEGENVTTFLRGTSGPSNQHGDEGSAARFFYSAKASKADRDGSSHPTVKPVKLMEWLVKMVTPKGGTLLDPFAGSGTTGQAALNCGMKAVLIEREDEYVEDIKRRFSKINLDQFT
jgi:DNA modification methylase